MQNTTDLWRKILLLVREIDRPFIDAVTATLVAACCVMQSGGYDWKRALLSFDEAWKQAEQIRKDSTMELKS